MLFGLYAEISSFPAMQPATAPRKRDSPCIRWCFTLNNPNVDEAVPSHLCYMIEDYVKYAVIGLETGDSGTPHFQGYFELKTKQRLSQIQDWWPMGKPHFELAKGTPAQNRKYCTKDGDFYEIGDAFKKGSSSYLPQILNALDDGKTLTEAVAVDPSTYVRNYRGIAAYQALINPPKIREKLECYLFYGKTGLGKTHHAIIDLNAWKKPAGKGLWFDGLTPDTKTILIDEFNAQYPLEVMLQITDKYPTNVEVKGGHCALNCDLIILSTNTHPLFYYENWANRYEQRDAFFRRLTKVYYFYAPQKFKILTEDERNYFLQDPNWFIQ